MSVFGQLVGQCHRIAGGKGCCDEFFGVRGALAWISALAPRDVQCDHTGSFECRLSGAVCQATFPVGARSAHS